MNSMNDVRTVGTLLISVLMVIGFMMAYALAYKYNDTDTIKFFNGFMSGGMMAVVTFWVGSSVGSRSKDETIRQSLPGQTSESPPKPIFPKTP